MHGNVHLFYLNFSKKILKTQKKKKNHIFKVNVIKQFINVILIFNGLFEVQYIDSVMWLKNDLFAKEEDKYIQKLVFKRNLIQNFINPK